MSPPVVSSCRDDFEPRIVQQAAGAASRRRDHLVLHLRNGVDTVFRDTTTPDGPGSAIFWLHSFAENPGYFILGEVGYEYRGSIVVNRQNGWTKSFDWDFPLLSESGRFLAHSVPLGTAYWTPTLGIYEVTPDSLIQAFLISSPTGFGNEFAGDTVWGPVEPHWVGEELRFLTEQTSKTESRRCADPYDYKCTHWHGDSMAVVLQDGLWRLRRLK